jgi:hypothetical protein
MPSTLGLLSFVAAVGLAGAGAAEARTLRVSASRVESAQADLRNLQVVVVESPAGNASLRVVAEQIAVPKLALSAAARRRWQSQLSWAGAPARGRQGGDDR